MKTYLQYIGYNKPKKVYLHRNLCIMKVYK